MDKVLIVDDIALNIQMLAEILKDNYNITVANSGAKAIELVNNDKPDLILLDVMMPDLDGYSVCKQLKDNKETKDIPIIFITAKGETDDVVYGFEIGAQDYILKPIKPLEVIARVKTHLSLKKSKELIENQKQELIKKNNELDIIAKSDYLTGFYNKRHMMDILKNKSEDKNSYFSILMIDIDSFKRINDTYGHEKGDAVITEVAHLIKSSLSNFDTPARWGGEEFLILLPKSNKEAASTIAENIRASIESSTFNCNYDDFVITITVGVTEFNHNLSIAQNINCADEALYDGKYYGKNRVVVYKED